MSQTYQGEKLPQDFPYPPLPYINFFQYPPMQLATLDKQTTLAAKLALDKPMSRDRVFTIFASIPYCRVRCHSCPYFKGLLPSKVDKQAFLDDYVDCLEIQIRRYAATVRFSSARCGAVYLGGGTASLLAPDQVGRIINTLRASFTIEPNVEITLEGNPHEFSSLKYLQEVKRNGVTRVSLGYQSSQDTILRKMLNSPHTANDSVKAVRNALATGFYTVNIDLLYRLPGQTIEQWQYDLQMAIDFGPAGITIYEYVIHSGSNSERLINRGILTNPTDKDTAHECYLWAREQLERNGYVEHRKGSFSKPGHEQQYGALSYGQGCESIGLGAGAYSFVNRYQFRAPDDAEFFKQQTRLGVVPMVSKVSVQATDRNLMERYTIFSFFSSLLSRQEFCDRFGQDPLAVFPEVFSRLERYDLVVVNDREIRLTDLGKKWRNGVFYEFYSDAFK